MWRYLLLTARPFCEGRGDPRGQRREIESPLACVERVFAQQKDQAGHSAAGSSIVHRAKFRGLIEHDPKDGRGLQVFVAFFDF